MDNKGDQAFDVGEENKEEFADLENFNDLDGFDEEKPQQKR